MDTVSQALSERAAPEAEADLQTLYRLAHKRKRLTLLFASKNENHNNATVLKDLLDGMRKPPTGTGPGALRTMRMRDAAVRRREPGFDLSSRARVFQRSEGSGRAARSVAFFATQYRAFGSLPYRICPMRAVFQWSLG